MREQVETVSLTDHDAVKNSTIHNPQSAIDSSPPCLSPLALSIPRSSQYEIADTVTPATRPSDHVWRRRLVCLLIACSLLLALYLFRAPLLIGIADAWIVNQPLDQADAIILLGGGMETRPFEAARLYRYGYAQKILIMKASPGPTTKLGITEPESDIARKVLLKQGVAEADIIVGDNEVTNSYEESIAVRNWVGNNAIKKVIIPTDVFHTRRVSRLFRRQLKSVGVQVIVRAVPVREYTTDDWWRHEQGVVAFQNEVIKDLYYRLRY